MNFRGPNQLGWMWVLVFMATCTTPLELHAQDMTTRRLQSAAQYLASGNLEHAENELQSVLRGSPDEYRALDLLGVVRVLQKRETDAERLFLRVVHIKAEFAGGHAHLGLIYLQIGKSEEAIPELQAAVRLDPARTDAVGALVHIWREKARAALTAGTPDLALAPLIEARKLAPGNPDVQSEFGTVALQMSLFEDAAGAFQKTLDLRKGDPLALYGLGRAFMGLSKFEEARQQFAEYVVVRPDDFAGHSALGMTLAALERVPEARAQFEQSSALRPAQSESYFRLGLMDLESKDWESATKHLQLVLEREPKHSGALTALGRVEFAQKHYADAASLLERAIAADNSLGQAHYYLGLTYARMGRKTESNYHLGLAVKLEEQTAEKLRTTIKIQDPDAASDAAPQKK
jgi:tetratricopeptide (TPR) repeat protein